MDHDAREKLLAKGFRHNSDGRSLFLPPGTTGGYEIPAEHIGDIAAAAERFDALLSENLGTINGRLFRMAAVLIVMATAALALVAKVPPFGSGSLESLSQMPGSEFLIGVLLFVFASFSVGWGYWLHACKRRVMNAFRREHLSRFPFDPRIRRSGYKRAGGWLRTRVLKLFAVVIFGGILLLLIQHGGPQPNKLADPGGSLTPTAALSTFLMLAILGVTAAMVYSLIKPSTKSPPRGSAAIGLGREIPCRC